MPAVRSSDAGSRQRERSHAALVGTLRDRILRGIPVDAILSRLSAHDFDVDIVSRLIESAAVELEGAEIRRMRSLKHARWMAAVRRRLHAGRSEVPCESHVSAERFYLGYYRVGRPCKLTEIYDDPRDVFPHDFASISRQLGGVTIEAMVGTRHRRPDQHLGERTRMPLFEYIEHITGPHPGDLYLTSTNRALDSALGSLLADVRAAPSILDLSSQRPDNAFIFIGPPGAITRLHYDSANVLIVQMLGQKRVTLAAPWDAEFLYETARHRSAVDIDHQDLEQHPLAAFARRHIVVLHPHTALFVPAGWWHQVESVTASLSFSLSNFREPNAVVPYDRRGPTHA